MLVTPCDSAGTGLTKAAIAPEGLFRLAAESLPTGILVVDAAGIIMLANQQIERLLGHPRGGLIGQSVDILLPGVLRPTLAERLQGFLPAPESRATGAGHDLFGRHADGSRVPVEVTLRPIPTETGFFVLASVVDTSERRRMEEQHRRWVDETVEFERLVGDLAARFVNLGAEQVDEAIEDAQRRILEALDLDRSAVFQFSSADNDFVLTHHWARQGFHVPVPQMSGAAEFPWSMSAILKGEVASFSSIDEVPDAAEREALRRYGTRSRVAFPLRVGGRITGVIGFASVREERSWPQPVIGRLHLVAQVFSGALARRQADAALRASEQRFHALADCAPAMIWISGPERSCTWFNRRWLEFVGRSMEHELGNGWARGVHPDDRDSCLGIHEESFSARRPFSLEYRLRRYDGEWRWILETAVPNDGADGAGGYIGSCIDVTEQRLAIEEGDRLRDQLEAENVYLRREVTDRFHPGAIVGQSEALRRVLLQVEQVAATDSTVLLFGETGTGKELIATRIHELSARRARAMVRVNCAAIPATLIESELFGREKGAYTGALARQVGRFELADRSTIFLDEIGDLPRDVQVKLLRVLEERQIERLGSPKAIRVDTRIIAATHRDLEQRITEGTFREDLFYRLNVFPIQIPPLRERVEDIPLLVWRLVEEFSEVFGRRIEEISGENMAALQQYSWPGNIRELRNVIERAMILSTGPRLTIPLPRASASGGKVSVKLADMEREHIRSVLESTGWRIRGTGGAADRLGLKPTTLETRLAKLGLSRPSPP
jgi:PAS domain S-box-containing protein